MDGVWSGKPGGARVLLGAEGPVKGLGDGTQVEGTHCRCCYTVALDRETGGEGDGREGQGGKRGWH